MSFLGNLTEQQSKDQAQSIRDGLTDSDKNFPRAYYNALIEKTPEISNPDLNEAIIRRHTHQLNQDYYRRNNIHSGMSTYLNKSNRLNFFYGLFHLKNEELIRTLEPAQVVSDSANNEYFKFKYRTKEKVSLINYINTVILTESEIEGDLKDFRDYFFN